MRLLLLFLFLLNTFLFTAQLPLAYQSRKQAMALGEFSKTADLVVVIENEKNPDDAALIAAIKNYWKIGPVKYMSGLEFSEKFKQNTLDTKNLYLYNNYARVYSTNVKTPGIAAYKGYYMTNDPRKLVYSTSNKKAPAYLHFSANALYDNKQVPISGFYSLMVKNFNHDISYCQSTDNFTKRQKDKRKKGIRFFNQEEIADKTLLLVKEQTVRQEKKKSKKQKKNVDSKKKMRFITDDYTNKKVPVIVFPEDIDYAVKKGDPTILLYTGGTLYSAKDGSAYATSRGESSANNLRLTYNIVSIAASVGVLIWFFSN